MAKPPARDRDQLVRHRVTAFRNGTTLHTPDGFLETNPLDGGAVMTLAQVEYFTSNGYAVEMIAGPAPSAADVPVDPEAAVVAEEERQATQRDIERSQRDVMAPLRKKTHDPKVR